MTRSRAAILTVLGLLLLALGLWTRPGPAPTEPADPTRSAPAAPVPRSPQAAHAPAQPPPTAAPTDTGSPTDLVEPGRLRVPARTVHGPEDETWVLACRQRIHTEDPSGWVELELAPGPCVVQGCRRTGGLQLCLPAERVEVRAGETTVANPALPAGPLAGLGVTLQTVPDGLLVVGLAPDGAADREGLDDGDLLTAIDDHPTAGMSLTAFRELGIGEAGTEARLQVRQPDGTERTVTLVREPVAP